LSLLRRAERYQRWHDDAVISALTSFFAAAAVVNRVLARHARCVCKAHSISAHCTVE
jgi:hypothetical protein